MIGFEAFSSLDVAVTVDDLLCLCDLMKKINQCCILKGHREVTLIFLHLVSESGKGDQNSQFLPFLEGSLRSP